MADISWYIYAIPMVYKPTSTSLGHITLVTGKGCQPFTHGITHGIFRDRLYWGYTPNIFLYIITCAYYKYTYKILLLGAFKFIIVTHSSPSTYHSLGPLGTPWDPLGPLGTPWDPLGPLGTPWDPLGPLGTPWDPLGPLGTPWDPLGPLGTPWDPLGPLGTPWDPLDPLGPLKPLRTLGDFWGPLDTPWDPLGPFGSTEVQPQQPRVSQKAPGHVQFQRRETRDPPKNPVLGKSHTLAIFGLAGFFVHASVI